MASREMLERLIRFDHLLRRRRAIEDEIQQELAWILEHLSQESAPLQQLVCLRLQRDGLLEDKG